MAIIAHSVGIDALRGLAVLLVWCHHLFAHAGVEIPIAGRLGGLVGVQLFFVISGFLIVRSATRERTWAYALRRALRIFPAYLVVVAAISVASERVTWDAIRADPFAFGVNLAALSHWWPPALLRFDVTTVNWTLAVEIAWYALAPVLVWIASSVASRHAWTGLAAGALAVSTLWVVAAQAGRLDAIFANGIAHAGVAPVSDFMRFAFIVNLAPAHLAFFAAGALILVFEREARRLPRSILVAALLVFVPLADRWNDWLGVNPSFASGIGLAALFVLWGTRPDTPAGWWLRWLARLGQISYPVYLVHVPVLLASLAITRGAGLGLGWTVGCAAAATLVLSVALHHLVEQPGIALGRALTQTHRS
jgi:peptidoglycan/LPS O-acetylase OafA/YrhL